MSQSRFTMSRDRLAELRGPANEKRYDRLSDEQEEVPAMPSYRSPPAQRSPRYEDDTNYRPPAPPAATYTNSARGDRYEPKDQYEMQERTPSIDPNGLVSTEAFFSELEAVKDVIKGINQNISDIEEMHGATLVNINEEQMSANARRLEQLSTATTQLNNEAKQRIKAIELSNARMPLSTGDLPMRKTQANIERTYQQKYRQRMERQIRIVKPDATVEEIEKALDSDETQIFAQSFMQSNRSGQARAVLNEVQTRHDDIKKIEKTILDLHQLFMDMQMMVEHQGEVLKEVEMHSETVVKDLEQGNKDIERAIVSAKSTRSKKWCCFVIFILLLIVAGVLVWWFAFGHPGIH
ncbi:t-SNARE [Spinellus fusiger]|nr:t-SNARE [Spinellus fusiger]